MEVEITKLDDSSENVGISLPEDVMEAATHKLRPMEARSSGIIQTKLGWKVDGNVSFLK